MAWNINFLSPVAIVLDIALPAKLQPPQTWFFFILYNRCRKYLHILKIQKQFSIIPTEN